MTACTACGAIVERVPSVLGAVDACAPCDLAFLRPVSTAASSSDVYFHSYSAPAERLCPRCRGRTAARSLVGGKHVVPGWYCAHCDEFVTPMVPLLRMGRASVAPPEPALRLPRPPPLAEVRAIDERDRVFAFLLGLPLELTDRIDRRPLATRALVALCVAVFVLEAVIGPDAADSLALHTERLGYATSWQMLTSIFVHVSLWHLLGNLYILFSFGRLPEARLGAFGLTALFVGAGLAGNLLFFALNFGEPIGVAGASGAIAGLLGFYAVAFPHHRVGLSLFFRVIRVPALVFLGLWFLLQVTLLPSRNDPTAYAAHIGGFVTGAAVGFGYKRRQRRRATRPGSLS